VNFPQLRELEDAITAQALDAYEAMSLMDCLRACLARKYEALPDDFEDAYNKLYAEVGRLEAPDTKPDEMDLARDFLVAKDEEAMV